jgi:hypothetical protein
MPPELIIGGRDEQVKLVHAWLSRSPSAFALQGESPDESLAFFLSAVQKLPDEQRLAVVSRGIIVNDTRSWTSLAVSTSPLILIPTFEEKQLVDQAVQRGHHIFVPLGKEDSDLYALTELPRLSRSVVEAALKESGLNDDTARSLATLARRSLLAYKRKRARIPILQRPRWSSSSEAATILPALLAGMWNNGMDGDREIVSLLAMRDYDAYLRDLVVWVNQSDPPVRSVGDTWMLVSKEDAWRLLARNLTSHDLDRFEQAVLQCLGTYDPRFDAPADQRYIANILGYKSRYSGLLEKGLADTLGVMGSRGDVLRIGEAVTIRDRADWIIQQLLDRANQDWRLWASLEHVLPLLAEAAPEAFMDAVDAGLKGETPVVMRLFDEDQGLMGPWSHHSGLLWALEGLAWSPDHLARATLLLAKLARLDPGGRLSNRPANSLREIFLLWHPQTAASIERRQKVLEMLVEREPEVGWRLLCRLLPEHHGIAHPTSKPVWREWVPEEPVSVTWADIYEGCSVIATWLVMLAGGSGERWAAVIDRADQLPKAAFETVVNGLRSLRARDFLVHDRTLMWNVLRELVAKHTAFSDADWAMPAEYLRELRRIMKNFQPIDPIERYTWLFSDHPTLIAPVEEDWEESQSKLGHVRTRAVKVVYKISGLGGVQDLLRRVERPYELGLTLARADILTAEEENRILSHYLGDENSARAEFIHAFVYWRFSDRGWEWAREKNAGRNWTPEQEAAFYASAPTSTQLFDSVANAGPEIERLYWNRVGTFYNVNEDALAQRIVEALLQYGRPYAALENIFAYSNRRHDVFTPTLVVDVLEKAARSDPSKEPRQFHAYHLGELLDRIEETGEIPEQKIAQLEWAFLPLLRHSSKRPPRILHRELQRNPDFFAEVVSLVYKDEREDEPDVTAQQAGLAELAYELLDGWNSIPGLQDDGTISEPELREWVLEARRAVVARGRTVGDRLIGNLLRHSAVDADGAWPPVPIRNLIEALESKDLEKGIEIEVYNSRGVTSRMPTDGGVQERELVERYVEYAALVSDRWPRTGAMLRRIAKTYSRDARREDTSAELTEDLWA